MRDTAEWIWFPGSSAYGVLRTRLSRPSGGGTMSIRCAAFDRYELYVDGRLVLDGALPGDLENWIPVDCATLEIAESASEEIVVDVLVYHSGLELIHYRGRSRAGFWAEISIADQWVATGTDWEACGLCEWDSRVPRMNHLLDPMESMNLEGALWRWIDGTAVDFSELEEWENARRVEFPENYERTFWNRTDLYPNREECSPVRFRIGRPTADCHPHESMVEAAKLRSQGEVDWEAGWSECIAGGAYSDNSRSENLLVVDFEDEIVGFPFLSISCDASVVLEIGWSERLNSRGVPILFSKGTAYLARFKVPAGQKRLRTFQWSGFRYLVIRVYSVGDESTDFRLSVSAIRRTVKPREVLSPVDGEDSIARIRKLCRHTLERTLPEFPVDCPSREKAHYWADGFWISLAWEFCYGDRRFMDWYWEAFRRVPLRGDGLFSSVYPGSHKILIDMCLIPLIGVSRLWDHRGSSPVGEDFFEKALIVLGWFENHQGSSGLVEVEAWDPDGEDLVFLDHPGLPWHQFDHPGLGRRNPSAALNLYYLYALQSMARLGKHLDSRQAPRVAARADGLQERIKDRFWDGHVLRDSPPDSVSQSGVSWLANSLGVLTGVIEESRSVEVMRNMVEGYDEVCRCSPGTIGWFLEALKRADLDAAARTTLVRLFQPMLAAGAVTTWETFDGAIDDSLCHPWLAAPVCLFLEESHSRGAFSFHFQALNA